MAEILNGGSSERMLGLLLAQFEDKPVIRAILELIGEEFDRMSSVRQDIRTQMWPDVAIGKQLDMCGEVADISRKVDKAIAVDFFGFPDHGNNGFGMARFRRYGEPYLSTSELRDEEYRLAIFSKIAKNTTDGSRQSTLDSIKRMFNISRVVAINGGNAKMRIGIGRYVTANELSLINELDLIIRGAGIGVIYFYWFNDGNTFGFSRGGENPGNFAGFGKGTFARLLQLEGSLG